MRDPLQRYIHRVLAYTIVGRNQSQEWWTRTYLFYLHSILSHASCNLAWCMVDTFTSYESKRPVGYIHMGGYVTHIAQRLGVFDADVEASMTACYRPERVGRATLSAMRIAADFRGLGFRFCLERSVPWVPQLQPQQGDVRAAPAGAPLQPPPPRGRRLVFRDPIPALSPPRQYPDDAGDDAAGGGDNAGAGDDAGGSVEDADGGDGDAGGGGDDAGGGDGV
ncbi:hypothetical protein R6Q57_015668 [Mikania cordata]